jgi:hypothetical protein
MGRHREVRGRSSGGRRAKPTRPRWNRLGAAGGALGVTLVAVLGGIGILPVEPGPAVAASLPRQSIEQPGTKTDSLSLADSTPTAGTRGDEANSKVDVPNLPANSGSGRRIVFAMADQRVWLVGDEDDDVERTYLVSGSLTDNLHPGTYSVYSKSEEAVGIDDSGTMKYMVRFAHGPNAAIGFHDIPVLDGAKVQTVDQLGTPQSHGCIRQLRADAKALWDFAPVGTTVVVVA